MPGLLAAYVRAVDTLSAFSGRLAGWMFFAVGLFVTYEVFMRYVLTLPTVWVDEISRILQIWATYLAVAYVLRQRKHILIDITFRDDTIHVEHLSVTLGAQRLMVEIDATDASPFDGQTIFEIRHSTPTSELADLDATLRIILRDVGTYTSEISA